MMEYKEIIDISVELNPNTTVYPGNPEFESVEEKGSTSVHSKITLGSHIGTHIDAPRHVFEEGIGIDKMDLTACIGPCKVLDMTHAQGSVKTEDLKKHNLQKGDRVLLKTTNSERGFNSFYDDYVYLDGNAAEYLAELEVALVAIDYLSIKQRGSSDNRPHTALLSKNIPIIETIDLSQVEEGEYFLSALPIKITNGDGAPLRAALLR